uniref:Uncharacterized protein n=1 Tax=Solanum lycopersicum TaxID=4081 RepID=A0A3Q7GJF1_SOLLC
MPKLRCLWIDDCPLLQVLMYGIFNLISLKVLTLSKCKKLKHPPSRDVMQWLTKLWSLQIKGCPYFKESCINLSMVQDFSSSSN